MKVAEIVPGRTYLIGRGCGVPFEWAPLVMSVVELQRPDYVDGRCWLYGYELDPVTGLARGPRTVYVGKVAGMRRAVRSAA